MTKRLPRIVLIAACLTWACVALLGCAASPTDSAPAAPASRVPPETWRAVHEAIFVASVAAEGEAEAYAQGAMADWMHAVRQRTEADFVPWFCGYWTQQWLGLKAGWYEANRAEGDASAAEQLAAYLQAQYQARVLEPVGREIDPDQITDDTTAAYVGALRDALEGLPERFHGKGRAHATTQRRNGVASGPRAATASKIRSSGQRRLSSRPAASHSRAAVSIWPRRCRASWSCSSQALGQAWLEPQAEALGRALDDLAEARARHGVEGDAMVALDRAREELEGVEEVRAQGGEHHDRATDRPARRQQQGEQRPRLGAGRRREDLLQLVDHEQDLGLGQGMGDAQLVTEGLQASRGRLHGPMRGHVDPVADGVPAHRPACLGEGQAQGGCEPIQPCAAHDRRRDDPAPACAVVLARPPQPRQDPGPHQGGFSAARGPQHHEEALGVVQQALVEGVDHTLDLGLAPEEHRRVGLAEGR